MEPTSDEMDATCGNCLELYTEPRDLQCGHTFCTLCLQDLAKSSAVDNSNTKQFIVCPKCSTMTYLDYRNVLGLQKNFKLANMADRERRQMKSSTSAPLMMSMPTTLSYGNQNSWINNAERTSGSIFLPPMPTTIPVTSTATLAPLFSFAPPHEEVELDMSQDGYSPEYSTPGEQGSDSPAMQEFYCIPNENNELPQPDNVPNAMDMLTDSGYLPENNNVQQQHQPQPQYQPQPYHELPPNFAHGDKLRNLEEMGFNDRGLNIALLDQYEGDVNAVITALISESAPTSSSSQSSSGNTNNTNVSLEARKRPAPPTPSIPTPTFIPTNKATTNTTTHPSNAYLQPTVNPNIRLPTNPHQPVVNPQIVAPTKAKAQNPNSYTSSSTILQTNEQQQGGFFASFKRILWGGGDVEYDSAENVGKDFVNYGKFKISLTDASDKMSSWISGLWLAPANFTRDVVYGGITAEYVPFWVYQATAVSTCTAENMVINRENVIRDLVACAIMDPEERELCAAINDWDLHEVKNAPQPSQFPFKAPFDWQQTWESLLEREVIKQEEQSTEAEWRAQHSHIKPKNLEVKVTFPEIKRQLIFLPVFVCQYTYYNKQYLVVISGQTGTVQGNRPYGTGSIGAIGLASVNLLGRGLFGTRS